MEYKIGERVQIRKDLKGGKFYAGLYCAYEMGKHAGEVMRIKCVTYGCGQVCYYLDDDEGFMYNDAMLIPVNSITYLLRKRQEEIEKDGKLL